MNTDSRHDVALNLARAWEFLSGDSGVLEVWFEDARHPQFAEFSVFMPLAVKAESRTAGIGVLIQREDAIQIASHMLGLKPEELTDADLKDACSEACNVFSGCISLQISRDHPIRIGLPHLANELEFAEIAEKSELKITYKLGDQVKEISVLVYGIFFSPTDNCKQGTKC